MFFCLAELALKARKEIADYIQAGKEDRARIRVSRDVNTHLLSQSHAFHILIMSC